MRETVDFNRKWAFSSQSDKVPETMPTDWVWVNVPHCWNSIDGQDGGNDYYRGKCFYAKEFAKSDLPQAEKYFIEFGAVNSSAEVYLNGKKLGEHHGGYSAFRFDMTPFIENSNLLVVAADNSANDFVYPQNADFTFYGGIYRSVKVIAVPKSHFALDYYGSSGLKITPEICGNNAKVKAEVMLTDASGSEKLNFAVFDASGNLVASAVCPASESEITLEIKNVHLWQGKADPYLYTMRVELWQDDEVADVVSSYFGCRTFSVDPDKGFFLNGKSYPLRGVSRHQDWWGLGNALLPEHHRADMDLICELGATTVRLAHYQHDKIFYDLCDENGIVVWAEIPYISSHMANGRENTLSQMKELILQNYNHPSIVAWGLSNEITISGKSSEALLENHRLLNDLAHSLDSTRLTTVAVVSMCDTNDEYIKIPDLVSYNHYFGWYGGDVEMNGPWLDKFHAEHPKIPIGLSEYGCEALNWHSSEPQQGDYTEEYQAYYHEEMIKQLFSRDYIWATHVWNMFDFGADARSEGGENGQNHKGLVTFDRKYKKDAFYAYKAWLSDESFVHICGKRYLYRVENPTKVKIYSTEKEVELFANGKSLGKQSSDDHFFCFDVPNEGETKLKAVAGACEDESQIRKCEKFCEDYRLKEKGAVLNWFDITAPDGFYSLNDRLDSIMQSEDGKALFAELMRELMRKMPSGGMGDMLKNDSMMQMIGSFTLLRLANMMGVMNVQVTKEQLLGLNERLNKIKKVN